MFFSLHVLYALWLADLYFGKSCAYYIQTFTIAHIHVHVLGDTAMLLFSVVNHCFSLFPGESQSL